jgi:isocitrate lyase
MGTENREAGRGLAEALAKAEREGRSGKEIDTVEADWLKANPLVTFDRGPLFG